MACRALHCPEKCGEASLEALWQEMPCPDRVLADDTLLPKLLTSLFPQIPLPERPFKTLTSGQRDRMGLRHLPFMRLAQLQFPENCRVWPKHLPPLNKKKH